MIDIAAASEAAIRFARKRLNQVGKISPDPVEFYMHALHKDGAAVYKQLTVIESHIPPWGWPSLNTEATEMCLVDEVTTLLTEHPTSLSLVMKQSNHEPEVVFDFLSNNANKHCSEKSIHLSNTVPFTIKNINNVVSSIHEEVLSENQCIIVTALDEAISFSEDLSDHMIYAMDGTNDILWYGTIVEKDALSSDVLSSAHVESAMTGRCGTMMILSGDIADIGDGRALIRHPHRIVTLDLKF